MTGHSGRFDRRQLGREAELQRGQLLLLLLARLKLGDGGERGLDGGLGVRPPRPHWVGLGELVSGVRDHRGGVETRLKRGARGLLH